MSFEEYIRRNKESFDVKEANSELWRRVDEDLVLKPNKKGIPKTLILMIIGSAAIVLLLFFVWQNHQQTELIISTQKELKAMKSSMNDLLQDQSAFKRIRAVSMSNDVDLPDLDIINALTNTMLYDKNENVQLAAINALEKFANEEIVKLALINALSTSDQAFFKIKLINILSNIKEQRALPLLNQIIDDKASQGYLRDEAITATDFIMSL